MEKRIPFEILVDLLDRILVKHGTPPERAKQLATVFVENSRDGVYSHGVNRFPRFIKYIRQGLVDLEAEPELVSGIGAIEQWDGKNGPGILNAQFSVNRAMQLASEHGIGLVALKNTHHWMRPGYYGWMAAERGFMAILWTNTQPNMPAWGAKDRRLGNNPMVFAIPRTKGPVILDMAMSQYSYGKLEITRLRGEQLDQPGGFDKSGHLTTDPAAIEETWRILPTGFWKGAGLSIVLDLAASILSGGQSVNQIGQFDEEYGLSQVYFCIDLSKLGDKSDLDKIADEIIDDLHRSQPVEANKSIVYPGERVIKVRKNNLKEGVPVAVATLQEIESFDSPTM